MKKFISFVSALMVSSVVSGYVYAGIYVSGSFSNMMNSSLGWDGNANSDQKYYLIDCSKAEYADFCTSSSPKKLLWDEKNKQSIDVKTTKKTMFSGAVGYFDKKKPFRFEVEYMSITNNLKSADYKIVHGANQTTLSFDFSGDKMTISSLMGNMYYSAKVDSFRPYVGAGIGYISGKVDFIHANQPLNIGAGLGFQFMGGIEAPVEKGMYVGIEYRNVNFGMLDIKESYNGQSNKLKKGSSSGLLVKFRYELDQGNNRAKKQRGKSKRRRVSRKSVDEYYY